MTTSAWAASQEPVLLCLSHLRWDFVLQRPQHLMKRAADRLSGCVLQLPQPGRIGSS